MPDPNDPRSYVGTGIPFPQGGIQAGTVRIDPRTGLYRDYGSSSGLTYRDFSGVKGFLGGSDVGSSYGRFAVGTKLRRTDTGEMVTVSDPRASYNLDYIELLDEANQQVANAQQNQQQVSTQRPSPLSVQATPFTGGASPLAGIQQKLLQLQRTNLANLTPQQRAQLGGTLTNIGQTLARYRQAYQQGVPQGTNLDSAASSRMAVQSALPPLQQAQEPTTVDYLTQQAPQDPYFQEIMTMWRDYMSPQQQRTSLTQEYQNLLSSSGLQGLDTELMNMKNVIEGTEDDIRNEVTKAGGFATDSQVLALTNARNKQLIKNYNTLLETRNQKEQYLNTMIGLEQQDRQMADQRFDRMMNMGFQMMDYQNRMRDNAKSSFDKIIQNVGYSGLLEAIGNDPYGLQYAEQSLGVGRGGLQRLASIDQPTKLDTDVISYGSGSALIDKQTGQVIKTYPGKPSSVTGEPPTNVFTKTQINKGASNAGLNYNSFNQLPYEVKNYYISSSAKEISAINEAFNNVKSGKEKLNDVLSEIDNSNIPSEVKEYLKQKMTGISPAQTTSWWENIRNWLFNR